MSHMHSTTVAVTDQDAALDFYVNTLGYEIALDSRIGNETRLVSVVPPGTSTQVVLGHTSWFGEEDRPGKRTGIVLIARDAEDAYMTLKARGVAFKQPIVTLPSGQRAAWFYDPDGNELLLVEE